MKAQHKDIKEINIGEVKQKLKVGSHEGGLDLMVNVYLDGEKVLRQKGNSFLQGLAYGLHAQMHGGSVERFWQGLWDNYISYQTNDRVTDVSSGNPIVVRDFYSYFDNVQDNDYAWVWGVQGSIGDVANGLHRVRRISNDQLELYALDNTTPRDGSGLSYGGGGFINIGGFRTDFARANNRNPSGMLDSWDLIIGRDSTPVAIDDFGLYDKIAQGSNTGEMNHSTTQISVQTTNKPSSRFVLSRSYTNNTGSSIDVNEIGIASRIIGSYNQNDEYRLISLLARDVLGSTVTVPDTSTLTVEYEVITNLVPDTQDTETDGTNGGFVDNFVNTLRAVAIESSSVDYENRKAFLTGAHPGNNAEGRNYRYEGYQRGIRVGTDQTFTSMTDGTLLSVIQHGEADGELYHYGSLVEDDVVIDTINDTATITVSRIFENRGSTSVTIKEIGLYANRDLSGDNYSAELIARTALQSTDWYTVNPGDYVKVTYEIEVQA